MSLTGALIGMLTGGGAWLVLLGLPGLHRPSLDQRLAPYLRGVVPGNALLQAGEPSAGPLPEIARPVLRAAGHLAARITGGNHAVERRLRGLGPGHSVEQFRARQVLCGAAGALGGAVLGMTVAAGDGISVVPVVGLVVIGGLGGVLGQDQFLDWQVRRRQERIMAEFPSVAEILALAVGAGEGPSGALERVARSCVGELPNEIARTLADSRTGRSLTEALNDLAARTEIASLARFVDGIVVAIERGTPLGDVLRAQAQDVRELTRRRLMESGGRREIGAMVPVVFLVLPVTVVFALYPGLAVLDISI